MAKHNKKKEDTAYLESAKPKNKVASILSALPAVAGAIPSLVIGPQRRALKNIQAGGGAGAITAQRTAGLAADAVVGGAGAGAGPSRALAGRAAGRVAQRIVRGSKAPEIAMRESLLATQALQQNEAKRLRSGLELGGGLSNMIVGSVATKTVARDQAAGTQAASAGVDPATAQEQTVSEGKASLDKLRGVDTAQAGPPQAPGPGYGPPTRQEGARPGDVGPEAPIGTPPEIRTASDMTAQVQVKRARSKLMLDTARAVNEQVELETITSDSNGIPSLVGSPAIPMLDSASAEPIASDPSGIEDYLYNMAANYDPAINQGSDPLEIAQQLEAYGFPVDWERLGVQDPQLLARAPQQYVDPQAALAQKATSGAFAAGQKIRSAFSGGKAQ